MATYFIRSSGGNDANDGSTPALAWATFARINAAGPPTVADGDTIIIFCDLDGAGVPIPFLESFIPSGATKALNFVFRGVVIDGGNVRSTAIKGTGLSTTVTSTIRGSVTAVRHTGGFTFEFGSAQWDARGVSLKGEGESILQPLSASNAQTVFRDFEFSNINVTATSSMVAIAGTAAASNFTIENVTMTGGSGTLLTGPRFYDINVSNSSAPTAVISGTTHAKRFNIFNHTGPLGTSPDADYVNTRTTLDPAYQNTGLKNFRITNATLLTNGARGATAVTPGGFRAGVRGSEGVFLTREGQFAIHRNSDLTAYTKSGTEGTPESAITLSVGPTSGTAESNVDIDIGASRILEWAGLVVQEDYLGGNSNDVVDFDNADVIPDFEVAQSASPAPAGFVKRANGEEIQVGARYIRVRATLRNNGID